MANSFITPKIIKERFEKIWQRAELHKAYLDKTTLFPLNISITPFSAKELLNEFAQVQQTLTLLRQDSDKHGYLIHYKSINHQKLGKQEIPIALEFPEESLFLRYLGKTQEFLHFKSLINSTLQQYPILQTWLMRYPFKVTQFANSWEKLFNVCDYFVQHPQPNCYLRQLDIAGVDTKFIEQHQAILSELLEQILPETACDLTVTGLSNHGFERRYGLRYELPQIRLRLLDNSLAIYGLTDLTLTVNEFQSLALPITTVFITENKMNGLAFPEIAKAIVIFGLGYAVDLLKEARCLQTASIYYWGDLDTHGFAILSRMRQYFPQTHSLLMDEETLQTFQTLWVEEPSHITVKHELAYLTEAEQQLFQSLQQRPENAKIRLEQERISYAYLLKMLQRLNSEWFVE